MKKYLLIVVVLIGFASISYAQQDSSLVIDSKVVNYPKATIKWNPLFMLNRFPTIQLGYEFNVAKQINVSLSAGYVMDIFTDDFNTDFVDKRGVKSGLEFRKYLSTKKMNTFFFSIGLDYFYIKYDRSRTFAFNCLDQFECAFFQFDEYSVVRQDRRANTRIGVIADLGDDFLVEVALGFAVNSRQFRTEDRISGFDIQYGDTALLEEENQFLFQPLAAINLTYRIK